MEYWKPFSSEIKFTPGGIFAHLLGRSPGFAISRGFGKTWTINAAQMDAKRHLQSGTTDAVSDISACFDRVSAYLEKQSVVHEMCEYIATGRDSKLGCPYLKECAMSSPACRDSVAAGSVPGCRCYTELSPFV